jgi:hypothetical protein
MEFLKKIEWTTVIAAVVITFILLMILGRR